MGRFHEEIIKEKRRLYPYLRFAASLSQGGWPESDKEELLYTYAEEGSYRFAMKGHVLSFGTFSRSVANALFGFEVPGISLSLMDPDRDWRGRTAPLDALVSKWLHILIRVYADAGDIYDGTVAQGMITNVAFPAGQKVTLNAQVAPPEQINAVLPRRTITLEDWPGAPPESVGRPVPILYGTLSNEVRVYVPPDDPDDPDVPPPPTDPHPAECDCPIYVPVPFDPGKSNAAAPGVRWSDHFADAPMGSVSLGNQGMSDLWLDENYHGIIDCMINPVGGPTGKACAETFGGHGYGELARGIGPQTLGLPFWNGTLEKFDMPNPKYGHPGGPHGACGMLRQGDAFQMEDAWPVLFEVWADSQWSMNLGGLFGIQVWKFGPDWRTGPACDFYVYVNGGVKRPNGAGWPEDEKGALHPPEKPWPQPFTNSYCWAHRKTLNCFVPGKWQWIEMRWRVSSFHVEKEEMSWDGWIEVWVEGRKVIHLQEIGFHYGLFGPGPRPPVGSYMSMPMSVGVDLYAQEKAVHWEGVSYRPSGRMGCLYLSDRLMCNDAKPIESPIPEDPCAEVPNVSDNGAGAIPAILVDATTTTELRLGRSASINAPVQENTEGPTNVIGYTGVPGAIAGGVTTYYRITGIKAGKETSWSELVGCDNALPHYDRIEWEPPPQGPMDSYRIYQTLTPDLNIHEDMGGVLREETYYVKTVPGTQTPGGRQAHGPSTHWVEWGAHGEGTPQQAATTTAFTTNINTYVIAGHACHAIIDVYALVTDLTPYAPAGTAATGSSSLGSIFGDGGQAGGVDQMTAELIPVTANGVTTFYMESEPRMRRFTEGTDYTVQLVDKPSGAFTVITVTRRMTNGRNCSFADVTCNVAGIEVNGDGSGGLLQDGVLQFGHFLLNYVFNDYRSGPWIYDVQSKPGLIDTDSFYEASSYFQEQWGGTPIGAIAMLEQRDVRSWIQAALTTFNLQFFYRNFYDQGSGANNAGAWAVLAFDTRQLSPDDLDTIEFGEEHMILDTFQTEITSDYLANVINYRGGPNLGGSREGEQTGWIINGTLEDGGSVERTWGRRELDLELPWTRDQDTATHVAGAQLHMRAYPVMRGSFQTMGRGTLVDAGQLIKISHRDGPGQNPSGWENRIVQVIGHDHDLDTGLITIKFMEPAGVIYEQPPEPVVVTLVFTFDGQYPMKFCTDEGVEVPGPTEGARIGDARSVGGGIMVLESGIFGVTAVRMAGVQRSQVWPPNLAALTGESAGFLRSIASNRTSRFYGMRYELSPAPSGLPEHAGTYPQPPPPTGMTVAVSLNRQAAGSALTPGFYEYGMIFHTRPMYPHAVGQPLGDGTVIVGPLTGLTVPTPPGAPTYTGYTVDCTITFPNPATMSPYFAGGCDLVARKNGGPWYNTFGGSTTNPADYDDVLPYPSYNGWGGYPDGRFIGTDISVNGIYGIKTTDLNYPTTNLTGTGPWYDGTLVEFDTSGARTGNEWRLFRLENQNQPTGLAVDRNTSVAYFGRWDQMTEQEVVSKTVLSTLALSNFATAPSDYHYLEMENCIRVLSTGDVLVVWTNDETVEVKRYSSAGALLATYPLTTSGWEAQMAHGIEDSHFWVSYTATTDPYVDRLVCIEVATGAELHSFDIPWVDEDGYALYSDASPFCVTVFEESARARSARSVPPVPRTTESAATLAERRAQRRVAVQERRAQRRVERQERRSLP